MVIALSQALLLAMVFVLFFKHWQLAVVYFAASLLVDAGLGDCAASLTFAAGYAVCATAAFAAGYGVCAVA